MVLMMESIPQMLVEFCTNNLIEYVRGDENRTLIWFELTLPFVIVQPFAGSITQLLKKLVSQLFGGLGSIDLPALEVFV